MLAAAVTGPASAAQWASLRVHYRDLKCAEVLSKPGRAGNGKHVDIESVVSMWDRAEENETERERERKRKRDR